MQSVDVGTITLKAGDDVEVPLYFENDDGSEMDMTDWAGWRSEMKVGGVLVGAVPLRLDQVEAGTVGLVFSGGLSRTLREAQSAYLPTKFDIRAELQGQSRQLVSGQIYVRNDVTQSAPEVPSD